MPTKHRVLALTAAILLLLALGVSRLQAQSPITLEGLSNRITTLARTVSTLRRTSATRAELKLLANKVATIEARHTALPPTPTATPTAAPAQSARPAPTPGPAFAAATRKVNIRAGPGTDYPVLASTTDGDRFEITGRNILGDWWRIDYNGQQAWIHAPYVVATEAGAVNIVPTPAPPTAPLPPPTATPFVFLKDEDFALYIIDKDNQARPERLQQWNALTQADRNALIHIRKILLESTAEYCDISVADASAMIDRHGQRLDDAGWSAVQAVKARATLMLMLSTFEEADRTQAGCDAWLTGTINAQLGTP